MKNLFPLLLVFLFSTCKTIPTELSQNPFSVITFGSCNKTELPQNLWQPIMQNKPDVWIWLGDIVYADSNDPAEIKKEYDRQKTIPAYQKLEAETEIIGIWDDHDYGQNDGGKDFSIKKQSRELLFDFLETPQNAPERNHEGGYASKTYGSGDKKVKVILLDCRYFRDSLERAPAGSNQRYIKNETGDILGEVQWNWLEKELTGSDAQIHIIGTGIQVIAEEHAYEKWSNFPTARKRLFDLLEKTKPNRPVFISGDRHIAEISKIELPNLEHPVYDITSSGLTHSYEKILEKGEVNQHRVGDKLTGLKNFGVFKIDWESEPIKVIAEIQGEQNSLIFEEVIFQ